jgi:hypothetical protein
MSHRIFHRSVSAVLVLLLALTTVIPALAAAPSNDYFDDAEVITSLPFHGTADTTEASIEIFEPQVCWFLDQSVWYSFTPSQTMIVEASTFGSTASATMNVFRSNGPGIQNLSFQGCVSLASSQHFLLEAGKTYYLQAGSVFGERGNIQINFEEFIPPPIEANFTFNPSDPSAYDTIQFCDWSFDPAGVGFNSFTWDFGDGVTSTANCANHKYAQDGDYMVTHSATTPDGRSGSISQVVQIRTHDVAITRISAPQSANAGQTRSISIALNNKSYGETVRVELYRSSPSGFQLIGSYSQYIPVRSGNRGATFSFNYTFTSSDASIGKVTFKAIAVIEGFRDALPTDNELISSPPTKVSR